MAYAKPLLERLELATDESSCCLALGGCWVPNPPPPPEPPEVPNPGPIVDDARGVIENAGQGIDEMVDQVSRPVEEAAGNAGEFGMDAAGSVLSATCLIPIFGSGEWRWC